MRNLLPVIQNSIEAVCVDWNDKHSQDWGFTVTAGSRSLDKTSLFIQDVFSENPALVANPGPFKVCAAFLVAAMHFVQFSFQPLQGGECLTQTEQKAWKTRLLFKALPLFLLQLELEETGKKLTKLWDVPSIHYRLDFLNLLRWCEFPVDGPSDPPPPSKPSVDMVRLNRLIMAVTLIIESCYYSTGNPISCDVLNRVHIHTSQAEEADLIFDYCPTGHESATAATMQLAAAK